jgi:hypothetical protein
VKQFGWWFASAKLDDEWSVYQLLEALRLARQVELAHLVVERLVSIARKMPGPSIQALGMIIHGDAKGWGVLGWSDNAKESSTILIDREVGILGTEGFLGTCPVSRLIRRWLTSLISLSIVRRRSDRPVRRCGLKFPRPL